MTPPLFVFINHHLCVHKQYRYNDLPGEEEELVYEDVDDDGGAPHTGGEELHPTYGDDAYGTVEQAGGGAPPPPRPPKKGPVEEEVLYGD